MVERLDCVVIGAGAVGLSIGRALAAAGREVFVFEAEAAVGTQTSSRNTGVIHAGIDYTPGSLKDRLCHRGRSLLYPYCASRGVGHRRVGKLMIPLSGSDDEGWSSLRARKAKAEAAGRWDIELLDGPALRRMEPCLPGPGALYSPLSGIIDAHELAMALWGDVEDAGGRVVLNSPVLEGRATEDGIEVAVGGTPPARVSCRVLINAAGLNARLVARSIRGFPPQAIPDRHLVKGSYFVFRGKPPFTHLVYPYPHGMHVSLDIAGQVRFGPDSEVTAEIDYTFDESRAAVFYEGVRRFWPDLPDEALQPGWTGIRPRTSLGRATETDFRIDGAEVHGIPGMINLFGIDSPGLTASLAIAEEVLSRLRIDASEPTA